MIENKKKTKSVVEIDRYWCIIQGIFSISFGDILMRIYQEKKEYTTNKKINEKNILTKILKK